MGETTNVTVGIEDPAGSTGLQYYYGRGNGAGTVGGTLPDTNPAPAAGLALLFTTGMLPQALAVDPVVDLALTVSSGMVTLGWSPSAGASAYRVESSTAQGAAWSQEGITTGTSWTMPAGADEQRLCRPFSWEGQEARGPTSPPSFLPWARVFNNTRGATCVFFLRPPC
jgi:hypothetical protein